MLKEFKKRKERKNCMQEQRRGSHCRILQPNGWVKQYHWACKHWIDFCVIGSTKYVQLPSSAFCKLMWEPYHNFSSSFFSWENNIEVLNNESKWTPWTHNATNWRVAFIFNCPKTSPHEPQFLSLSIQNKPSFFLSLPLSCIICAIQNYSLML